MIRFLVLVLVLAFLADSAFGDIGGLLQALGLSGPRYTVPLGVRLPGSAVSWSSPIGDGFIGGYGR